MKYVSFCLIILFSFTALRAQNETDALRHSLTHLSGSARALGMGGAFSSVGADMTANVSNPAGLGFYRSSQFVFSPAFRMDRSRTEFLDDGGTGRSNHFALNNWAYVYNKVRYYDIDRERREVERGLKSFSIAFGQNHVENYYRTTNASAFNPRSSIGDMWASQLNGLFSDQIDGFSPEGHSWDTFITDNVGETTYAPIYDQANIQQTIQRIESGRRKEFFLSFGGNFDDMIYLGGKIGLQRVEYSQEFRFYEEDVSGLYGFALQDENGSITEYSSLEARYTESFTTTNIFDDLSGVVNGINASLGVIIRPSDMWRIGLSAQTPTAISLRDEFTTDMVHVVQSITGSEEWTPDESFITTFRSNYQVNTPAQVTAGLTYFLGKTGFVSADLDLVNYAGAQFVSDAILNSDDFEYFEAQNQAIDSLYKAALNLRLGGEYRLDPMRIRVGYALYGTPYSEAGARYQDYADPNTLRSLDGRRRFFTLGFGVRQPKFFLDVAYINQRFEDKYSPYYVDSPVVFSPTVINRSQKHSVMMTMGFNF